MDFDGLLEKYRDEIISSLRDFIKIRSVRGVPDSGMPYGRGPQEALEYVLKLSESMGFQVKNVDGYVGHAEFGEGKETIGVLVHVDVVPEGDGWTFLPFSGEIHEGKIYGRGAIDDKGPTISALYALKILKASGVKLKRKIRIVFGTDEENGFEGINYYLSKEKAFDMGFTPDARFPLIRGEKGILLLRLSKNIGNSTGTIIIKSIKGGTAANMVPGFCTAFLSLENGEETKLKALIEEFRLIHGFEIDIGVSNGYTVLSSTGRTAHASTPEEGLNAISIMMMFLNKLLNKDHDITSIVRIYNEKICMHYNGESMKCSYADNISGKLTLNVGKIDFDGDKFEMAIDIRYPISFTADQIIQTFKEEFDEAGFEIEQLFALDPICFSEDNLLIRKLMKVYRDITNEHKCEPLVTGGATYARAIKNVVAFGPVFPDELELAHKSDEYITMENLMKLTRIYTNALYELAK